MKLPMFTAELSIRPPKAPGYRAKNVSKPFASSGQVVPQLRAEWGCDCFPCGDGGTCCVCCDGCGPKP